MVRSKQALCLHRRICNGDIRKDKWRKEDVKLLVTMTMPTGEIISRVTGGSPWVWLLWTKTPDTTDTVLLTINCSMCARNATENKFTVSKYSTGNFDHMRHSLPLPSRNNRSPGTEKEKYRDLGQNTVYTCPSSFKITLFLCGGKKALQIFFLTLRIPTEQWYLGMWIIEPGESYLISVSF